ncbi:MAG: PPOX class F420-dependent oxidoreductase [Polyangiales bacterium]
MATIPKEFVDIVQKPTFAHFSTLMDDGSPHSSPVWIDMEGERLVVNSAEGRLKDRNIRRDPRVALSLTDPDNSYRALNIRGRVTKITREGADEHIDQMAKKYMNVDKYPFRAPNEQRVKYYIDVDRVATMG